MILRSRLICGYPYFVCRCPGSAVIEQNRAEPVFPVFPDFPDPDPEFPEYMADLWHLLNKSTMRVLHNATDLPLWGMDTHPRFNSMDTHSCNMEVINENPVKILVFYHFFSN